MERPKEGVRATCVADSSVSWDGAPLPDYPTGRPRVTVVHYEVAPHARLALHRHPVINAGMVLRGELTVVAVGARIPERPFGAVPARILSRTERLSMPRSEGTALSKPNRDNTQR